jgi:hypothetical protein
VHPVTATGFAGLLSLLALSACDDAVGSQAAAPAAAAQASLMRDARVAAEDTIRRSITAPVEIGELRGFPQAAPESIAICGQVALAGSGQAAPFIAIVNRQPDGTMAVEQYVATDRTSATRVFVESHARCTETASRGHRGAPPPLPVVPTELATLTPPPPAQVARVEEEQRALPGGAILRQNANMRQNPNGGGEVLKVVPRGTTLRIFAEAPGGWLQLGTDAPEGWVHGSMVARAPSAPSPQQAARADAPITTAAR